MDPSLVSKPKVVELFRLKLLWMICMELIYILIYYLFDLTKNLWFCLWVELQIRAGAIYTYDIMLILPC